MAKIHYARVDEFWRREQKYVFLYEKQQPANVEWQTLQPDERQTWLTEGLCDDFESFIAVRDKSGGKETVFASLSPGVNTARDPVAYNFSEESLLKKVEEFCDDYNAEVNRYIQKGKPKEIDDFLVYERIKRSRNLKRDLQRQRFVVFTATAARLALYRPFTKLFLYFEDFIVDELGKHKIYFPDTNSSVDNRIFCLRAIGNAKPFHCLVTNVMPDFHLTGDTTCLPFYTYDEDGTNRRENITDWALEQFRTHYNDSAITKWNIFHYVYAILHHPVYRERYAANLKRELPRIPFAPDFHTFAEAGARLAELHVNYEQQPEYPLEKIESPNEALDWRVQKMKLSKDKAQIVYNKFLTLSGIPPEAFEYRLGNRSALEWVIDQYQVSTDKRSGITNDPNREDDPQYIVRLIGQVITVSLETMKIVKALPATFMACEAGNRQ